MTSNRLVLALAGLSLTLSGQSPVPAFPRPLPGENRTPAYTPAVYPAPELLAREARWVRNQVWTSGDVADASTFLFPRGYDVTSGCGFMGTDFFTWMLEYNTDYFLYDQAHDDHQADVPVDTSNDAAIERVMMASGTDTYDMGCWSVAMSVAARNTLLAPADRLDYRQALTAYHRFLITSSYPGGFQSYRAYDASGPHWLYGETGEDAAHGRDGQGAPTDQRSAYYWQYPAPRWQNPDPHWDPLSPPGAQMDWPGWAAVTGEEAWAAFLGPMQVAYNQSQGQPGWSTLTAPVDVPALMENASRALHAVQLMQNSATGALYRQVMPVDAKDPSQGFGVSTENNWSMYAGLGFLERALMDYQAAVPAYRSVLAFDLDGALASLRAIRGRMAGFFGNRALVWHAKGEPFGEGGAVDHAFFLQGTFGKAGAAAGNTTAFAPDVETWGIAALLADRDLERTLEASYEKDFLFEMFRSAVDLAGYRSAGGELLGIGFNTQAPGDPKAQLSGEWTWGAVNAAIALADFHREPAHADPAKVQQLLAWARSLRAGVDRLCSHDYRAGGRDWVGYLYANTRGWIPWGWWSNPCPSQSATSWALMVNAGFNPFELGGGDHAETARALGLAGGMTR